MPENPRRGVVVVQRQIVDTSNSMSSDCILADILPMTKFLAGIASSYEHWRGRTIAVMLRHTNAGDIGAMRAGLAPNL